jgi:hypothetical protein
MPDIERRGLAVLIAGIWAFALVVNVNHVEKHLIHGGASATETTWLRWAPDVLLLVGAWKLRYRPRSIVAWTMLASGLAWLVWAALSMAGNTPTAKVISLLSIGVALLLTLALELKSRERPAPEPDPEIERLRARAAELEAELAAARAPRRPVKPRPPAPVSGPDSASAPVSPSASREPQEGAQDAAGDPEKRPAPSREQAEAILQALPDFELVSDKELARLHGGSDRFWAGAKKRLREKLAELTTEAQTLERTTS